MSINSCIMMGRLTADPELRHTPNGKAVTTFSLAVDRTYTREGTERQTDFFDVVAWNKTAEFVSRYFHKGQLVAVQGRMETRFYEDKNGIKRKVYEIVAENVHFAEPKRDSAGNTPDMDTQPASSPTKPSTEPPQGEQQGIIYGPDDDLPFN